MTLGDMGDDRPAGQRRDVARDKARALRASQKKRERRNRVLLQGGITVGIVAVVAVVALTILSIVRPPAPGPLNMLSDGIKIGQNFKVARTAALQPGDSPVPSAKNRSDVIDIRVFIDYQCPLCRSFEKTNATQLSTWLRTGAATLEIHPIALLDNKSLGAKYSTRAANAAACVANFSPNSYFDYSRLLFDRQPKELTTGLTDDQLISLVRQAKVSSLTQVTDCVKDQTFKSWVNAATARATEGPIPGSDVDKIAGTPTIIINGTKYDGSYTDKNAFSSAVAKAAGDSFATDSGSTPSPTPSPTATSGQ